MIGLSCRYNPNTDCLELSYSRFKKSDLPVLGHVVLAVFQAMRLVDVAEGIGEDGEYTECSNMTIINLTLRIIGPTHERRLTIYLLAFQVIFVLFVHLPSTLYFALFVIHKVCSSKVKVKLQSWESPNHNSTAVV